MALFNFNEKEVLTSYFESEALAQIKKQIQNPKHPTFGVNHGNSAVRFEKDQSSKFPMSELENQFINFQLSNSLDLPPILESSQIVPALEGSAEKPDILVNLEMLSFHIGANEDIDKNTRATIRINIGKDENSRDKLFDTTFWSIAAGINLYNQGKNKITEPKDLKSDFKAAFGNRPIEIPGGLSIMSFEVVKHQEPKWWQKVFKFLQSDGAKALISTIGFPAISLTAINMVDELVNRLEDDKPEVLFKSLPLRLALSKQAKDDFTGGNPRVKMGSMNPGFCVLARGKDFDTFINADAIYYPSYGKLVPSDVSESQLVSGNFDDPFKDVTYSVFKVGMKETKLDPNFDFG